MTKSPLVSVVVAVRNNKDGIRKTLDSIFCQTYTNLQVIVIDGASTDGTRETIEEHYATRIAKFVSEPDKGVYDAMNKGIALSTGAFVNFMNSGDRFHAPDSIEQMQLTEGNRLFYGDTNVTYYDGTYRERPHEFFKTWMKFKGVGICHQTMFFPGEELRKLRYDLSYRIVADYALVYELWKKVQSLSIDYRLSRIMRGVEAYLPIRMVLSMYIRKTRGLRIKNGVQPIGQNFCWNIIGFGKRSGPLRNRIVSHMQLYLWEI